MYKHLRKEKTNKSIAIAVKVFKGGLVKSNGTALISILVQNIHNIFYVVQTIILPGSLGINIKELQKCQSQSIYLDTTTILYSILIIVGIPMCFN